MYLIHSVYEQSTWYIRLCWASWMTHLVLSHSSFLSDFVCGSSTLSNCHFNSEFLNIIHVDTVLFFACVTHTLCVFKRHLDQQFEQKFPEQDQWPLDLNGSLG